MLHGRSFDHALHDARNVKRLRLGAIPCAPALATGRTRAAPVPADAPTATTDPHSQKPPQTAHPAAARQQSNAAAHSSKASQSDSTTG